MILYKKQKRLVGIYYGGQGFANSKRILTDWFDEDDTTFDKEVEAVKQTFDYYIPELRIEGRLVKIENKG